MRAVLPPSPLTRKTLPMRHGKHGYLLKSKSQQAENISGAVLYTERRCFAFGKAPYGG
jgi:hypothetical protein